MSSEKDSMQKSEEISSENTSNPQQNEAGEKHEQTEKEKHSTPVIPYTGNAYLEGGRTRLTADGEKTE